MSAYHHHRLPLFIAERKTTCKEATSQDLTDHRALREQLHTIRTASLEERHGRERNWKAEKNVTETENHSTQIYNCADGNQYCKSMTKPQPRTQICTKHIWYWFFEFGSKRSSFNPGIVSEFYFWWSEQTSVPIIYFLRILRCTLTSYIPTHHQDLHIRRQRAKQKTSIDPNGYSMGSKSNMNPNLMKFITQHSSVHVMRKEKAGRKSEAACWNNPNLIPHTVPTLYYSSQLYNCTKNVFRDTRRINETISIFRCQRIWLHAQMIRLLIQISYIQLITNTFSSKSQQQHFFPLSHSPVVLPRKGC